MNKRFHVLLAALVAATITLTGCATEKGEAASAKSEAGGTVTYLEPQTWKTLYPPAGGFYPNGGVINQITDRLLYQNPETLELEPWIASELPQINSDATEYTFKIRDGVTYSDGSVLDAANVAKNFDLFGKGDKDRTLNKSEAITNYDHSEVIDPHTVKFYFSAPAPGFTQAVSTINSGLVSNATLDRTGNEFGPGNAKEIIGSGPFVVSDEKLETELHLTARKDYNWAPPSRKHQGAPLIDGVKFIVSGEASVRVGSVVAGQAHIARQIDAPDEKQFDKNGLQLLAAPTNGVTNSLSFRIEHPLLRDVRVRQALIAGINRNEIVNTLFSKNYPLATGILAKTALGYTDTSSYYKHDPARAAKLLDEVGFVLGTDGIREKDGQKLKLTFNEALPQPRSKEVVTLIQQQLKKIGVQVEIFSGDQTAQDSARKDINSIQVYHSMVGRADYDVLKSQFFSTNRNALLNYNPETKELVDPKLDELMQLIASVATEAERQAASADAQKQLADNAYVLPLFEEPQVFGYSAKLQNFKTESVGRPSFYEVSLTE
ncbi:TIGR04028 family ABC transporter substrate-binding protein [Canibacter sp. lx-72]|uniref:TIGR04028 family ABC transporter substrate-binding protein n=1 Tax=Canibacter zhuwentaonis TaxID=2837491 RepID=UPI001BDCD2DE|nr:TIGR04028 family ABC transporter substrate-binding protein [Canibacter zhuwentaonis]MBT1018104.1 TIGR04028 family ABC transporter substrate-binding protein [Canibacter zhuwentaonis]MBT1035361.1 TIGR04028 family ABC transporter substrate-binding protein [Canibacter zhuwentaonis]